MRRFSYFHFTHFFSLGILGVGLFSLRNIRDSPKLFVKGRKVESRKMEHNLPERKKLSFDEEDDVVGDNNNRQVAFPGFTSASGKNVNVDKAALTKVKSLFENEPSTRSSNASYDEPKSSGVECADKKSIPTASENIAPAVVNPDFSNKIQTRSSQNGYSKSSDAGLPFKLPGFGTASGKKILKNTKKVKDIESKIFDNDEDMLVGGNIPNKPVGGFPGFGTASGKKITIDPGKLREARAKIFEAEEAVDKGIGSGGRHSFPGFGTASGKKIRLNQDTVAEAVRIFDGLESKPLEELSQQAAIKRSTLINSQKTVRQSSPIRPTSVKSREGESGNGYTPFRRHAIFKYHNINNSSERGQSRIPSESPPCSSRSAYQAESITPIQSSRLKSAVVNKQSASTSFLKTSSITTTPSSVKSAFKSPLILQNSEITPPPLQNPTTSGISPLVGNLTVENTSPAEALSFNRMTTTPLSFKRKRKPINEVRDHLVPNLTLPKLNSSLEASFDSSLSKSSQELDEDERPMSFSSLTSCPSTVRPIQFTIAKVYPVVCAEKLSNGRRMYRTQRQEERLSGKVEMERENAILAIKEQVIKQFKEESSGDSQNSDYSDDEIDMECGEGIYKAIQRNPEPSAAHMRLTRSQSTKLESYVANKRERYFRKMQTKINDEIAKSESTLPFRNVSIYMDLRVIDASDNSDLVDNCCILRVTKPNEEVKNRLKEGRTFAGTSLTVINTTKSGGLSIVAMSEARLWQISSPKPTNNINNKAMFRRRLTPFSDFYDSYFTSPRWSEVDFVAVFVKRSKSTDSHVYHFCDETGKLLSLESKEFEEEQYGSGAILYVKDALYFRSSKFSGSKFVPKLLRTERTKLLRLSSPQVSSQQGDTEESVANAFRSFTEALNTNEFLVDRALTELGDERHEKTGSGKTADDLTDSQLVEGCYEDVTEENKTDGVEDELSDSQLLQSCQDLEVRMNGENNSDHEESQQDDELTDEQLLQAVL